MIAEIKAVIEKHKDHIPVKVVAELLAVMEDSCTWKWRIEDGQKVYRNCLYKADTHIAYSFKYCPYCGKLRKEEAENEADI